MFSLLVFCMVSSISCEVLAGSHSESSEDPDLSKVRFFLWSGHNKFHPSQVELTLESIQKSHIDGSKPIIILSHGWNADGHEYGSRFASAYLSVGLGDWNIISIDWGRLESWANYPGAAEMTRHVGRHAATLVLLLTQAGMDLSSIHLIGHSLGAHVVGFIGKEVQSMGLGKVSRITGLDPAKPFFELATIKDRIDKSDAEFVDIIHTNSGNLWDGCLSIPKPLGHIDFYPAGGEHQPGCTEACLGSNCINMTIEDLFKGGCSHDRANEYFIESIKSTPPSRFLATSCRNWDDWLQEKCCNNQETVLGQWLFPTFPSKLSRQFYLMVEKEPPFSMGKEGLPWCGRDPMQDIFSL